uniref:ANK_REP_REGION domain-containing protein n=1 Tax=Trichobilharzia regenti TaxID=157069 RepID=A0AA85JZH4_TRIRE|nr:unnamed protein product [Trichobilharzia regenti]
MTSTHTSSRPTGDIIMKLLTACRHGDLDYLGKFLVDGGNLHNIIDIQTGQTPLHYCVKCIEEKGENTKENQNNNNDHNIFKQYDRLKCTRVIIKSNPEFLTSFDHKGFTPMHLAVVHGDIEFLKVLNEFGSIDMKIKTKAKSLLSSSTATSSESNDSNEMNNNNNSGRTVLHLCVIYIQIEVLNYFLTNLNANSVKQVIDESDDQGATALHYSVQVNPEQINELFELLVNIGGANLNSCDTHGRTPLIWAATVGAKHAVESLLALGANLNHKDTHGLTALHCAASRGHLLTVQAILNFICLANKDDDSKVAAFRDVCDNDGCSPLFYSVATGHSKVTECLLKAGTDVMHSDYKGRTVCHCLARLNSLTNGVKCEKLITTQLEDLIRAGLDPWKANNSEATALHEACLLRNFYLIKHLANLPGFSTVINARESQGHSPLHLVVAASWSVEPSGIRLCQFLLDHNADTNAVTYLPNGEPVTPLNLAYLNETTDGKSKTALIDLLKQYGSKTYQELMLTDGKNNTDCSQNVHNNNDNYISNHSEYNNNTNDNINDSVDNLSVSGYISSPEKELKLTSEKQILCLTNKDIQTGEKEIPVITMTDSATEPIDSLNLCLTLKKDSAVQACLDSRRRRGREVRRQTQRISISSSNSQSTDKLIKQDSSSTTVLNYHAETHKHPHKSGSESSLSVSVGETEDGRNNISSHYDDIHRSSNASRQLIVRMPSPPSNSTVKNDESSCVVEPIKNNDKTSDDKIAKNKRLNPKLSSSKNSTKVDGDDKVVQPYSQIYLQRQLPLAVKKYLEKENYNYSSLIRRSRMPKPTISPYLQPVVPGLVLLRNQRQLTNTNRKSIQHRHRSDDDIPKKYNIQQSVNVTRNNNNNPSYPGQNHQIRSNSACHMKPNNNNKQPTSASPCSLTDPTNRGRYYAGNKTAKPAQKHSQSSKHLPSSSHNIDAHVQQSVADYEFYRYVNQLLKEISPRTRRKTKLTRPTTTTTSPSILPKSSPYISKSKLSVYEYADDEQHSAMGGELTPVGDRDKASDDVERRRAEINNQNKVLFTGGKRLNGASAYTNIKR